MCKVYHFFPVHGVEAVFALNCFATIFVEQCPHPLGLKLVLMNKQINILLPSLLSYCWLHIMKTIQPANI